MAKQPLVSKQHTCKGHTGTGPRRLVHLPVHKGHLGLATLIPQLDHTLRMVHRVGW